MRRILCSLLIASALLAQDKPAPVRLQPLRQSPPASVGQDVGISRVEIAYHRPFVRGRKVWGDLVPHGDVWRMGANNATTLTLSHAALVAGKPVPAGTYGLFAIPGPKTWTLILNTRARQWGAYDYKASEDLCRFEVTPQVGPFQEALAFTLTPLDTRQVRVTVAWEKLQVSFPIAFDTPGLYWSHLEATLAKAPDTDPIPWLQAARYCQEQGLEPAKAMAWIEKSLKAGETAGNHEVAARLLKAAGRGAEALPHLERAIQLSQGKAPADAIQDLERLRDRWKAEPPR
mgnify:CR=1 FL=1